MNLTGIFEMSPYNIPQSDFNMSDDAQNTSLADTTINQLGRRKAKILKKIIDDIWLCSSPKGVVLLDRIQLRIIYYVEYQIEYIKLIKTTALTQVLVWRDRTRLEANNIAPEVFFNLLLPKAGIIMAG